MTLHINNVTTIHHIIPFQGVFCQGCIWAEVFSSINSHCMCVYVCVCVCVLVTQSYLTLCDPMDCSPPGSSVHGILQARILEWNAITFSRGSSWSRDQIWVSWIASRFFTIKTSNVTSQLGGRNWYLCPTCDFAGDHGGGQGFHGSSDHKESACQCRRQEFNPWIGKIPWRRKWHPTPVFLPGEFRQRNLAGYSQWGHRVRHDGATLSFFLSWKGTKERLTGKEASDTRVGLLIFCGVFSRPVVSWIHFVIILAGSKKAQWLMQKYILQKKKERKKENKNKT